MIVSQNSQAKTVSSPTSPGSPGWGGRGHGYDYFKGEDALGLFLLALGLLVVGASVTHYYRLGPWGVPLTELVAILLPVLLWSRTQRVRFLESVGLDPVAGPVRGAAPRLLRYLLGGLLCGAAWFYAMALFVEPLLERLHPLAPAERAQLLELLAPRAGLRPLWADLLCFALTPALCEEVLFRGVLLRAFALPGLPRSTLALLFSSLLFGAFHLSAGRFLPTAVLALGFGGVVLFSGSLWPAIAMHLCNNALVIVLVRRGHEEPPRSFLLLAGAALFGGIGLTLLAPQGVLPDGTAKKRNGRDG